MADDEIQLGIPTGTEKASDFKESYCNHNRMAITPFDIAIFFGHIAEKATAGQTRVIEDFAVRLSPQSFKLFVQNLNAVLGMWESQFGPVTIQVRPADQVLAGIKTAVEQLKKDRSNL
jgi:hypothetical protein